MDGLNIGAWVLVPLLFSGQYLICPSCRRQVPSFSTYCNFCGALLRTNLVLKICPNCNNRIPVSARFCPECGHKQWPKHQTLSLPCTGNHMEEESSYGNWNLFWKCSQMKTCLQSGTRRVGSNQRIGFREFLECLWLRRYEKRKRWGTSVLWA